MTLIMTQTNWTLHWARCTYTKQSGTPRHVDIIGSVNTARPKRYGWNTSKEGSLGRKAKKNKVQEIQLTDLASLGGLTSKNGLMKQIWPLPDCTAIRSEFWQ